MAPPAADRAAVRVIVGGDMPAQPSAFALGAPAAHSASIGACNMCELRTEPWSQPLQVDLEVCLLHRRLNQVNSLVSQTFAARDGRSRRARLTGADALKAGEVVEPEDVLR